SPMPEPAPVINAVFPSSRNTVSSPFCCVTRTRRQRAASTLPSGKRPRISCLLCDIRRGFASGDSGAGRGECSGTARRQKATERPDGESERKGGDGPERNPSLLSKRIGRKCCGTCG